MFHKHGCRVSNKKRVGIVWKVSNNDESLQGYFKHASESSAKSSGPLTANEYTAYLLAKEIELPVAEIEVASINGTSGIISKKMVAKRLYNWNKFKGFKDPFLYVHEPERLIKMFIFDTCILNIDRNN